MIICKSLLRSSRPFTVVAQLQRRLLSDVVIDVSPRVSLIDERVKTVVSGLQPKQKGESCAKLS